MTIIFHHINWSKNSILYRVIMGNLAVTHRKSPRKYTTIKHIRLPGMRSLDLLQLVTTRRINCINRLQDTILTTSVNCVKA